MTTEINRKLEAHEIILTNHAIKIDSLESGVNECKEYKLKCLEFQRRETDKLATVVQTQQQICSSLERSAEYDRQNAENLQLLAQIFTTIKTGKMILLWIAAVIGAIGVIIGGTVATWAYMAETISIAGVG